MSYSHSTRTQGTHGSGGPDYSAVQAAMVADLLRTHIGPDDAITIDAISSRTGLGGRTVREIISQYDGILFLIGCSANGVYSCSSKSDATGMTARLESQLLTMRRRLERRGGYMQRMS